MPEPAMPIRKVRANMKITIENLHEPLSIDEQKPRFSYVIEPKGGASRQASYRIVVKDGQEIAWDSGVVRSEQSVHIEYGGIRLKPYTAYTVDISCTDDLGNSYSGSSSFETGKLDTQFAGEYIGAHFRTAIDIYGDEKEDGLRPVVFRKKFRCDQNVKRARLYVSSMGLIFAVSTARPQATVIWRPAGRRI